MVENLLKMDQKSFFPAYSAEVASGYVGRASKGDEIRFGIRTVSNSLSIRTSAFEHDQLMRT
jgi:hypothetical protein